MQKTLNTRKKMLLTAVTALFSQLTSTLIALLLPNLIIFRYGSDLNGVISTARQFSNYLTMVDSGIAAATCYQFIKAFKDNDKDGIRNLYCTVGDFFRKVAYAFVAVTVILSFCYGFFAKSDVELYLQVYIFIMYSLGTIVAFWTFFKYNLVLFSSGKQYTITFICVISNLFALILQVLLIKIDASIFLVIAAHPLCIIARLIVIRFITIKQHPYIKSENGIVDKNLISQKWDSIILNIADSMKTFAPILCISLVFGAAYASVYTIYESILHLGSSILVMCSNGITPILGKDLIARNEQAKKQFRNISGIVYLVSGIIVTCFASLFMSFINIYIGKESDISYYYPIMAYFMIFNVWLLMIRTNYELLIKANGMIKELKNGAVCEIVIAVIACFAIGMIFGFEYCIIGVIISSLFRTIRMCIFCADKLEQGKGIYLDLILWFSITAVISTIFVVLVPEVDGILNFIIGCAVVLLLSIAVYGFAMVAKNINYIKLKFLNRKNKT